jgi:PAS domain S-box-containing protein
MFDLNQVVLGIIWVILGLGLPLLSLLLLRLMPRLRSLTKEAPSTPPPLPIPAHNEAVLMVQSGGRIAYINKIAREWFNLWEDEPNLESLARRTRPSETFLSLCASEGLARFSLNGRPIEGVSYFTVPSVNQQATGQSAILVTLRRPQLTIESEAKLANIGSENTTGQAVISSQAITIFSELAQTMASSLDLEVALRAILESVERLIPADFYEITIWEANNEVMVPYRLVGLTGVDRRLERGAEQYRRDQGYSGYIARNNAPLLIKDINLFREARPALDRQHYPFQSYLGVPMLVGGQFVGAIELAALTKDNFSESDLDVLNLLAGQAAIALNNAMLFQEERRRAAELAGLSKLAQTVNAIRDPQDLYSRLIDSIAPLLQVEILGFLVYDENRRVIEGQIPFLGIQPNVVELSNAHTFLEPGSPGDEIWRQADPIISTNAPEDSRLDALNLSHLALAAGIRNTALLPLNTGGRSLGYLQVANKKDGTPFNQDDLRFLSIIAGQSAPIIENAALVQQSRHRAQRAETLRRIASLTSSSATLDEILKFSILDLSRLLQADIAAVFLLDENRAELRLHRDSTYGIAPEVSSTLGRIPINAPEFSRTTTGSKNPLLITDLRLEQDIPVLYQPLVEQNKILSTIDVPLVSRERGVGELIVGSMRANYFTQADMQTVATAAGQLAAAIEQSTLYSQTDQSLRQRVEQLTALTRVSRELNTTLVLPHLMQRVYEEALRTTNADCGSILLFDLKLFDLEEVSMIDVSISIESNQLFKNLNVLLHFGDALGKELHPLEQKVILEGNSIVIDDFEGLPNDDTGQPTIPPAHKSIRSSLIVPIAFQDQIAGLLHLHSKQPQHFEKTELEIVEALAIQAAIAMGNAQRYHDQRQRTELLNRRVETLSKLFEVSQVLQTEQPLEQALEAIAYAIQASTPFEVVLISICDPETNLLQRITGTGIPLATMAELRARSQPWKAVEKILEEDFRIGRSYFIPAERFPIAPADLHIITIDTDNQVSHPTTTPAANQYQWNPEDIMLLPLYDEKNLPLGLISVDAPRNNLRPDRPTIETLEIFGSQAALIIESKSKVRALRTQLDEIQEDLKLARAKAEVAQTHLPDLLNKDLQQTITLQQLNQRSQRIFAGLNINEIVNRQTTHRAILETLGSQTLTQMNFDVVMVVEQTPGQKMKAASLELVNFFGTIPPNVNPHALLGQRNPLRHCLQTGELLLVSNLDANPDWQNTPLLRSLDAKSFVCVPISGSVKGEPRNGDSIEYQAAILAINHSISAPFTSEDRQLFSLLSRQAGSALQNLNLLEDTSRRLREVNLLMDFSRQLGSLDLERIMQALIDSVMSVVPAAQTAFVTLWEEKQGVLITKAASGYSDNQEMLKISFRPGEGLPGNMLKTSPEDETEPAIRLDEVDIAKYYNLRPENLLHYRSAAAGRLPVSCLATPITASAPEQNFDAEQVRGNVLGVLVLENHQLVGAFNADDQALVISLAQQTALTLENVRLYQTAEQRSGQLRSLTQGSATITSNLKTEDLIATLLDQLFSIVPFDTGTLWIRQQPELLRTGYSRIDRLVIEAARGFDDNEQRIGLTVNIEDSQLLNEMIQTGQPIWVPNIMHDERFRPALLMEDQEIQAGQPGFERLSWLGVPLIAAGQVNGVIALEKTEPYFFTTDDIQVATTFAGQVAVSLENAKLFQESIQRAQELDQRSQTLTTLNRLSSELSSSLDFNQIINASIQEIAGILPSSTVAMLLYSTHNEDSQKFREDELENSTGWYTLQAEYPALPFNLSDEYQAGKAVPELPLFDRLRATQGIFASQDVTQERELEPFATFLARYKTHSLLIVPISSGGLATSEMETEHYFYGLICVFNNRPYQYQPDEYDLARTISNQMAIALQNARYFNETRSLTQDLEKRVEQRTVELVHEQQRVETLLRIITELSASLDLDQVLNRTLKVLNEYVDAEQITIFITRLGEKNLYRLASISLAEETASTSGPSTLQLDQGLAGWVITHRQAALIDNVQKDERWITLNYAEPIDEKDLSVHRSALGVPLMSGAEALGCLLLFHSNENHFSDDQLDMVQAAANQVAVAVNNAELFRLIRDQAEDLGTMLRNQQVETSRSKAILEAVADGVLVTDARRQITLFNESAERILELERSQVVGKSLEQFIGLFGRAAQRWMETIITWSKDPTTYQAGDSYAEQLTIEDGRVIAVRLAPVSLRNDFLGTVSIFQDITHQVEVDRLKSEFVATVSHELRTPMTSIKGYVEILLMGAAGNLNDQQTQFLQIVKANTERLSVLVNDLLDISQIESGRVSITFQAVNLEDIIKEASQQVLMRSENENKPVDIDTEIGPDIPRVFGDPDRIRNIFENLMDNAYQYNEINGRILVRLSHNDKEVQIDISDTGLGIHPDDLSKVFERFFRGEQPLVLGVSGTGLGLSIVRNLVEMHNGRIWAESAGVPGKGSTFSFTLPIYEHQDSLTI